MLAFQTLDVSPCLFSTVASDSASSSPGCWWEWWPSSSWSEETWRNFFVSLSTPERSSRQVQAESYTKQNIWRISKIVVLLNHWTCPKFSAEGVMLLFLDSSCRKQVTLASLCRLFCLIGKFHLGHSHVNPSVWMFHSFSHLSFTSSDVRVKHEILQSYKHPKLRQNCCIYFVSLRAYLGLFQNNSFFLLPFFFLRICLLYLNV